MKTKILRKTPDIFPLKHIRVIDGDTLEADICLPFDTVVRKRVRLRGWWADELVGPFQSRGILAMAKLDAFCSRHVLWLHAPSCRLDKYGRALGHLMVGTEIVDPLSVLGDCQLTEKEHKLRKDMASKGPRMTLQAAQLPESMTWRSKGWPCPCGPSGTHQGLEACADWRVQRRS